MSSRNQYVLDFNSTIILDRNFFEGRSPTIVAAFLVYTLKVTPDEAVGIILKERPFVKYVESFHVRPNSVIGYLLRPNPNFSRQLDLFHDSQGNFSRNDEGIRLRPRRVRRKCRRDLATREPILDEEKASISRPNSGESLLSAYH